MILVVGDKPSKRMKPGAAPFEGAKCEARLKSWLAVLVPYPDSVKIINRVDPTFALHVHMAEALNVPIIALGNNASQALADVPHFKLPHPSGLNRKLNDKDFEKQQLELCKQWLG